MDTTFLVTCYPGSMSESVIKLVVSDDNGPRSRYSVDGVEQESSGPRYKYAITQVSGAHTLAECRGLGYSDRLHAMGEGFKQTAAYGNGGFPLR